MDINLGNDSVLHWLDSQNHIKANCAKSIINSEVKLSVKIHTSEVLDWLAVESQTSECAKQAYYMVCSAAN
jgi:hypothetical protein